MADDQARACSPVDVADWLESNQEQLLDEYLRGVRARRGRVLADRNTHEQAVNHAKEIFAYVVSHLRSESASTGTESTNYRAKDLEAPGNIDHVHPVQCLQAAEEFFRVVMTAMISDMPNASEALLVAALLALHQGISTWTRESAVSYYGFLLDKTYRANIEERRHLARELHDRVGAGLSIAHRQLDLQEMCRRSSPDLADQRVSAAHEAIIYALDEVREVTSDLHLAEPPEDLVRALQNYLDSAVLDDVKARVVVNGDESWIPPRIREQTFLVIRESLRNALTHGHCSAILVRISIAPHELRGAIEDDGQGFNADEQIQHAGTGLTFMHERVTLLDGLFEVSSSPGLGTHVEFMIPLCGEKDGHNRGDNDRASR